MISLIICSRQPSISKKLEENISLSIGVEYQLVIVDNSQNSYSIFEAYNEGVRRSIYPYLCFMHEDILFHTQKWGIKVINHFQRDHKIGLIGVVGTHYLPATPAYWCHSGILSGHLIQGFFENGNYKNEIVNHLKYIGNKNSISVVAVDGLWFCTPKSMFLDVSFDDNTFSGFHCYDMDICLQIIEKQFEIEIIMDVLIEHSSSGSDTEELYGSLKVFYKKWKHQLPLAIGVKMTKAEESSIKKRIRRLFQQKSKLFFLAKFRMFINYVKLFKTFMDKKKT